MLTMKLLLLTMLVIVEVFTSAEFRSRGTLEVLERSQRSNKEIKAHEENIVEEVEEMADMKMEKTDIGGWKLEFKSHGRLHKLHLKENRKQLEDIPINLIGMSEEEQMKVKENLKGIKLMTDSRYRASFAIHSKEDVNDYATIQSGVFKLGKHEFTIDSHIENRARVVKRSVERAIYKSDGVKMKEEYEMKDSADPVEKVEGVIELVVVIDYSNWVWFKTDIVRAKDQRDHMSDMLFYFAHVVGMMDVAYTSIKNPDLKLGVELAGMVVITCDNELTELTEDHKQVVDGRTIVDGQVVLNSLSAWLASSPPSDILPPYDHVMLFSHYDLSIGSGTGLLGIAWLSSLCNSVGSASVTETLQIHTFVADTATHELGHSLASDHDGQAGSSIECEDENYIMAATAGARPIIENRYLFSCCSQRSFWGFLRFAPCLTESVAEPNYPPAVDENLATYQPGEVWDADDQCFMTFGTPACDHSVDDRNICHNLFCVDPSNPSDCVTNFAAASDGTECDVGKWCSQGECVPVGDFHITRDDMCRVTDCYGNEGRCKEGMNNATVTMGYCYSADSKCDGFTQCADGSDELNCGPIICPDGYLKCPNGFNIYGTPAGVPRTCIPWTWYCDGVYTDCSDGSDEGDFCSGTLTSPPPQPTTTTPLSCDVFFTNAQCGVIQSPDFPSKYRNHANCVWSISVPGRKVVELRFKKEVEIEDDTTCSFDKIRIVDGNGDDVDTLCGVIPAETKYLLPTNSTTAYFTSDGSVNFDGFKVHFNAACVGPDPTNTDTCEGSEKKCSEVKDDDCQTCDIISNTCCQACQKKVCKKSRCQFIKKKRCKKGKSDCESLCRSYEAICGEKCCKDVASIC